MGYFLDTNILLRLANISDPLYSIANQAILKLQARNEVLFISGQNLIEFRNSATRPQSVNGLGLLPFDAEILAATYESAFVFLPDIPNIFDEWKLLVQRGGIIGKQVHDARLVAICQVYGITHLLTFNLSHFARLAPLTAPNPITVVDPATI